MAFITLREAVTGELNLVNTDFITRVASQKSDSRNAVSTRLVLRLELAEFEHPVYFVPVNTEGDVAPDERDDDMVVRNFSAFLKAPTRRP